VKPSNIFLMRDGRVRLLDFGIARPPDGLLDTTLSLHVAGTPACMAPEQLLDPKAVDGRADLWAVGATIYRGVTGKWPRELPEPCASLLDAVNAPVRPIESLAPTLPWEIVRVVNRALERDPESRWQSAGAMRQALLRSLPKGHEPIGRGLFLELR
jgi:serine/threonine protein kinase